jgi:hypothetical protein
MQGISPALLMYFLNRWEKFIMKKLNREEDFMYVEKIRKGLGSDDEVTRWVEEISLKRMPLV